MVTVKFKIIPEKHITACIECPYFNVFRKCTHPDFTETKKLGIDPTLSITMYCPLDEYSVLKCDQCGRIHDPDQNHMWNDISKHPVTNEDLCTQCFIYTNMRLKT